MVVYNICFSDECIFTLIGQLINIFPSPMKISYLQKLNVWAGLLDNHIIRSIFMNIKFTGELCRALVQNPINRIIIRVAQDDENLIGQEVVFATGWGPST